MGYQKLKQGYEQVALVPRSFSKIGVESQVRVQGWEGMASDITVCCREQMLFHLWVQLGMHILGVMAGFSSSRDHPQLDGYH